MTIIQRCLVCGEPFIGAERTDPCPYCGAPAKYIIFVEAWTQQQKGIKLSKLENLTDVEKKNLESALKLAVANAKFYKAVANYYSEDPETYSIMKFTYRVEKEHVELISKRLGIDMPPITAEKGDALPTLKENIIEAKAREERTTRFYGFAASEATNPIIKMTFKALTEIKSGQIAIHSMILAINWPEKPLI